MTAQPFATAPTSHELAAHLDATRITGRVATPREANLANIQGFLDSSEHQYMGIPAAPEDTWDSVFDLMVARVGISPDRSHTRGQDTISAELCVAALDRYARLFGRVVQAGGRILFGTAHPGAMPAVYAPLALAARAAGAEVIAVHGGIPWDSGEVRQVGDLVMVEQYGGLRHTHRPEPMQLVLERLEAAHAEDPAQPVPDLVVTDHGMAGAAGARGYSVVAVGDCNDPAVFVGESRGLIDVVVPLDDNVPPEAYAPMTRYILEHAGLRIT